MSLLLRKLFIKDYQNIQDPTVRIRHGIFVSVLGIIINIILIGLKLTSAILIAASENWVFSMALVGDSINNAGDIASSVVSLIGFRASSKPADKEHPFGYQRMEYIASLVVSMIIIFAAVTLLKESITHIIENDTVNYDVFAYIVFGISVTLKIFQSYMFFSFGKAINSTVLKGVGMDSLLDIISSTVLLASTILSSVFTVLWLDAVLGIGIACFVGFSGIRMAKESINLLVGGRIDKERSEAITKALLNVKGVLEVHDLIIHTYGASNEHISAHIEVDASLTLMQAHHIAEKAESAIKKEFHQPITLHVDPKQLDPKVLEKKEKIMEILRQNYADFTIHDFQIDKDVIYFDILIPYGNKTVKEAEFEALLKEKYSPDYRYHITIDHPFDQE